MYETRDRFHLLGGIITDKQLNQVRVSKNDEIHEAEIMKIDDNLFVLYSILDYQSYSDEPDKMKIEALVNDGLILLEEALEGDWGG